MTSRNELFTEKKNPATTRSRLIWTSLLAMATAVAVNLGLYAFVCYLFPYVADWPGTSPTHILIATILFLTLAALVFAVVKRLSSRPARHYLIVATISLLLSLGQPILLGFGPGLPGVPAADPTIAVTLGLMHVIAYAISVPMFIRMALD